MRRFVCIFCVWLGVFMGLGEGAMAQTVTRLALSPAGDETSVTLYMSEIASLPKVFTIDGDSPRVVVDFSEAEARFGGKMGASGQKYLSGAGHIATIRYAARNGTGLRVVFDLKPHTSLVTQNIDTDSVHFVVKGADLSKPAPMSYGDAPPQPISQGEGEASLVDDRYFDNTVPYPRLQPSPQTEVNRRPVIVIDAGHGGHDPGAIGGKGTHEKKITLAASLELQAQLLKTGRYEVILTRDTDEYLDHEERLRIARIGGADLFISVHADSTATSKARGASVYTLAARAKGRTKEVINAQNWIMDVNLDEQSDPVGDILVDLAQRKTWSQSAKFADVLVKQLANSTKLIGNTHRRAGYYVLLAPDVPAVLLELGFLSNPSDEALLVTRRHREKMMRSVTTAINLYFDNQKS